MFIAVERLGSALCSPLFREPIFPQYLDHPWHAKWLNHQFIKASASLPGFVVMLEPLSSLNNLLIAPQATDKRLGEIANFIVCFKSIRTISADTATCSQIVFLSSSSFNVETRDSIKIRLFCV